MDEFDSAFRQLGRRSAFDAVRILDPASSEILGERQYRPVPMAFPELSPLQTRRFYASCVETKRPVVDLSNSRDGLLLLLFQPVDWRGGEYLSEFLADVTNSAYLEGVNLKEQLGLLSEIANLRKLSFMDGLTGLYNRRYLDERLPVEVREGSSRKYPISVIFSDLDYYKRINDRYGHAAGDHVLRGFGGILSRYIRKDRDWVARYGGEEFLIFLYDTDFKAAREVAERIRVAVCGTEFRYHGCEIRVTCSFGVYTVDDFEVEHTVAEIIDEVDRRLYQAKSLGRNIVVP